MQQIAFVLEAAGLVHVERHGVGVSVGRGREHERRVAIDEPADEPCRREPIDARPRTRHPDTPFVSSDRGVTARR